MKVIYQKKNGDIIERIRNTYPPYRVGDKTSMGWRVLNILYNYNGKYYEKNDYFKIVDRKYNMRKKKDKIKTKLYNVYKELVYCLILLMFLRFFEMSFFRIM